MMTIRLWIWLNRYRIAVLLTILLGVLLRSYQLDYNLDGDEIFSVEAASGSFAHVLSVSLKDFLHPPLHNFLLFAWIKCFKNSEVAVRIPSVILSVLFLASLHWFADKVSSRFAALLVVLLCSVSPFFVFYGELARPYSLAACLAVLSVCAMMRGLESPARRWGLIYGVTCGALVYTQYLGILFLLPQFVFIAFSTTPARRRLLWAGAIGVLSILPWLSMIGKGLTIQPASTIRWISRPETLDLVRFFLGLFGYLNVDGSTRVLLLLYIAAIAALLFIHQGVSLRTGLFLGALAIFGPVALWIISRVGPISAWAPRQLIGSAAISLLLVSIGVSKYTQWIRLIISSALVVWCLLTVSNEFPSHSRPPWRMIASRIDSEPSDTAVVVSEGFVAEPLRYYSHRTIHLGNTSSSGSRLIFLCRPSHCQDLEGFARQYKLVEERTIDWVKYAATPTSILKEYVFERSLPGR